MRRLSRIKTVATVFSIIALLSLTGILFSNRAALRKSSGQVASIRIKWKWVGKRHEPYSITTLMLAGSRQKFVVVEEGEFNSFLDRVNEGDTLKLYKRSVFQSLPGVLTGGNTYRVEKNGELIFDDIKKIRVMGFLLFGAFTLVSLLGVWLYHIESRKLKPQITSRENCR